jgi:hypothetical protein
MQGKSVNENILANLLFTLLKVSRKQLRRNTLWDMVATQLAYRFSSHLPTTHLDQWKLQSTDFCVVVSDEPWPARAN